MTTNLTKFGYLEMSKAADLLEAYSRGYGTWASTKDLEEFGHPATIEVNTDSGYVFMVNEDGQVAMLNDNNELEMFLTCGNCGVEGFRSDPDTKWFDDCTCSECEGK